MTPAAAGTDPAPFVPTFEDVRIVYTFGPPPGWNPEQPDTTRINDRTYATDSTARALQEKFGAGGILLLPEWAGLTARYTLGNMYTGARERVLVFPAGSTLRDDGGAATFKTEVMFSFNAGILADEFRRNPEDKFPGCVYQTGIPPVVVTLLSLAQQNCWRLLRAAYADAAREQGITT